MIHRCTFVTLVIALGGLGGACGISRNAPQGAVVAADATPADAEKTITVGEARGRAQLLHEALHGALQVMHRDLFREDEKLPIPSRSLEDVFEELTSSFGVELRWLAVNTDAMNVDHNPRTDFEKAAAKAIASGQAAFEEHDAEVYRHAGLIRLSSQCLKCHVPNRKSTEDRAAGLIITVPLKHKPRPGASS